MTQVALFRNLNLGHVGSPTKQQLIDAFASAQSVRSFQTNGTVLFESSDPEAVLGRALQALEQVGYHDHVLLRTVDELRDSLAATGEAPADENVYRTTLSYFDAPDVPPITVPLRSGNGLVEIRRIDAREAAAVCWQRGSTIGDVNAFLERTLSTPVTTRTLGTVQRLLAAADRR
jgi:uncharacterized protein (DUF1697 family)